MKRSGLEASAGCSNSITIDNVSSDIKTIQPTLPLFQQTGFWRCTKTGKKASGLVLQMEELRVFRRTRFLSADIAGPIPAATQAMTTFSPLTSRVMARFGPAE